jgi:hypothetical protein
MGKQIATIAQSTNNAIPATSFYPTDLRLNPPLSGRQQRVDAAPGIPPEQQSQ